MAIILPTAFFAAVLASSMSFKVNNETEAFMYLDQYGYLGGASGSQKLGSHAALPSEEKIRAAIRDFQTYAHLKPTGVLDEMTLAKMNAPRCGVADKIGSSMLGSYKLQGSRWHKHFLTYRINQYSRKMPDKALVRSTIAKAFQIWSKVSPLRFKEVERYTAADIELQFVTGHHGDEDAFDGPGNTLAHAYFPAYGGDVHFDDDESWTVSAWGGTNLLHTTVHELGHSLGLEHSANKKAVMYAFYPSGKVKVRLHRDDKAGIKKIYGRSRKTVRGWNLLNAMMEPFSSEESRNAKQKSSAPDLCEDASLDTVTRTQDGSTYVFHGDFYWGLLPEGIADGYPRRISEDWNGMPGNLDASFTSLSGKTFFFKGSKYWRFTNQHMDDGYPKLISERFMGIPENPNAAFQLRSDGTIYFFKDDKYWGYNVSDHDVSREYPRPISDWKGLPDSIDAVFQWQDGRTYFFKDEEFYLFNDQKFQVDDANPPYPRSTGALWFRC